MKLSVLAMLLVVAAVAAAPVAGQVRGGGNPYSSQLRTDPDVGTIQGIQRYGRPLATDPAEGDGYPYFVFPSLGGGGGTLSLAPSRQESLAIAGQLQLLGNQLNTLNSQLELAGTAQRPTLELQRANLIQQQAALTAILRRHPPLDYGGNPASLTTGLRSPLELATEQRLLSTYGFDNSKAFDPLEPLEINHRPLIQVKLRVVEVIRDDALGASSTLDYVRNQRGFNSLVAGRGINNINSGERNLSSVTQFGAADTDLGLLGIQNTGTAGLARLVETDRAGALVNLTSRHLNWVAKLLATELNADVLTAPELLTTNGENVEFTSGSKLPFQLGSASAPDETVNHFFYKHVGAYVSVTPRIVNFGRYGRGNGDASIVASDVRDWNRLIRFMIDERLTWSDSVRIPDDKSHLWEPYTNNRRLVPREIQQQVLRELNHYSKSDLRAYVLERSENDPDIDIGFFDLFHDAAFDCGPGGCHWKPEDCTIDLEIVARFSEAGTEVNEVDPTDPATSFTFENNVRAVANVLQVKSGNGVVMAGLIGERDIEGIRKTPILGDVPVFGALFRAKGVNRVKSEILIFIEARVLDPRPEVAHMQSIEDVHLGTEFMTGGTLDNYLELGLQRAGAGAYLPPGSHAEMVFWEKLGRSVRKIKAAGYDALY